MSLLRWPAPAPNRLGAIPAGGESLDAKQFRAARLPTAAADIDAETPTRDRGRSAGSPARGIVVAVGLAAVFWVAVASAALFGLAGLVTPGPLVP